MYESQIFCRNIAWLRKKHGLSKKEMAKILGIGLHSLNNIEMGEMPPRLGYSILLTVYQQFGILPSAQITQRLEDDC